MDYIKRSLSIVNGELETDLNSYKHAFLELKKRHEEIQPLVTECIMKNIDLNSLSIELAIEWHDISLALEKKYENFNYNKGENNI